MAAYDGTHGLMLCLKHTFDLAIVDIFIPNKDGLEVIMDLNKSYLATAQAFGADVTISKPFTMPQLLASINQLFGE